MRAATSSTYEPNTRTKTEVQLSRKLVVKGTDIRKMDEEALLQLVAQAARRRPGRRGKSGGQNDFDPYYYYRFGRKSRRAWSASFSTTSTSSRRKRTRRRSPTPGPGPSGSRS